MSGVMEKYEKIAAERSNSKDKTSSNSKYARIRLNQRTDSKEVLRRGFQRGCRRRKNCYGLNTIYNTEINHIIAKGTGCAAPFYFP